MIIGNFVVSSVEPKHFQTLLLRCFDVFTAWTAQLYSLVSSIGLRRTKLHDVNNLLHWEANTAATGPADGEF